MKQENHNCDQQIESSKKENQRFIQDNRRLEQEMEECKKKIGELEETSQRLKETIERQNLRTATSNSTSRTSMGASAMASSKCKFESKSTLKKISVSNYYLFYEKSSLNRVSKKKVSCLRMSSKMSK